MGHATYGWSNYQSISAAVDRALSQVKARFGKYVDAGPMIYAGFSQGAILADKFLVANATRFPFAVLAEGGYEYLTRGEFARKYRAAGGRRLMLLCGTPHCLVTAKRAKAIAEREGLEVLVEGDPTAGHNLNKPMQDAIGRDWAKFVAGIPGWETYSANRP
jgi:predicted esterase